jgi:hypothetical protein
MPALGGGTLDWSDARAPCLASLAVLATRLRGCDKGTRDAIISSTTPKTMLEGRQGAKLMLASSYECSVQELAAFFTEQALPAPLKPDSRKEYVVGECHAPQLESERTQKVHVYARIVIN